MNEKICTFFGHRFGQSEEIERQAKKALLESIDEGFSTFYSGGMGDFDIYCESVLRNYNSSHKENKVRICLILPYHIRVIETDRERYEYLYDELILPFLGDKVYPKAAIQKRNRWICENAERVIGWAKHSGGAMTAIKYAQKIGREVVLLSD